MQGQRQVAAELVEGIDDVPGAKGRHVVGGFDGFGTAQRRQPGRQQPDGDGDGQIGVIVVGQGDDAPAAAVGQAGQLENLRLPGVGRQRRNVDGMAVQVELADPALVDFDHHGAQPELVEGAADQLPGFAVAAHQVERLPQVLNLLPEALQPHGVAEVLVLQQRQQHADRIGPADHRQVDTENHPQPLRLGEGVGNFAETDGGRGVAHEVEGVQEAHPDGRTVGIRAGDQGQPGD